jgi:hypothetical protein
MSFLNAVRAHHGRSAVAVRHVAQHGYHLPFHYGRMRGRIEQQCIITHPNDTDQEEVCRVCHRVLHATQCDSHDSQLTSRAFVLLRFPSERITFGSTFA